MGSLTGFNKPAIAHPLTEGEDALAAFICLFRVRLAVQYLTYIVFYFHIDGSGFFEEEGRVPFRNKAVWGGVCSGTVD